MGAEGKRKKKLNSDETAMFCDQIAMLLNSGIPLYEGTYMLYSEMEDGKTKEILRQVDEAVRENIPLYQALEDTGAFPEYMTHMVYVGERTGKLEEVMRSLASFYERDSRVKAGIKSAIAYPLILFAVMAGIMVILAWKILPMFERMFEELNSDVANATESVLGYGLSMGKIIAVTVCVLFGIALLLILWSRTRKGKKVMTDFFASFGPTKKLMELLAISKFISSTALMLSSGMDLTEGLMREADSCENKNVRSKLNKCLELYQGDTPLDEAVRDSGLVHGMESRLVAVAAQTGGTDVIFSKLGDQYNEKTTAALGKLTTIIETALVIVLSVMVGAVLLSVMLPLVSMISAVG